MTTQMTMGMPNSAVIVLMGKVRSLASTSQRSITTIPVRIEAGTRIRWSASAKRMRATCGTARPMNPIGPQKAVTVPASRVVERKINCRERRMSSPIVRA